MKDGTLAGLGVLAILVIILIFVGGTILFAVSMWRVFQKAGRPGWAALVPIHNMVTLFEIAGKPGWLIFFLFIPFLNYIIMVVLWIIAWVAIGEKFNKGPGFGVGCALLSIIFVPIPAFGDAVYQQDQPAVGSNTQ